MSATTAAMPSITAAQRALTVLPSMPLCCRVDGIMRNGECMLMELEPSKPALALHRDRCAAERCADATLGRPVGRSSPGET